MRVVVLGPPGSGKSTQARLLALTLGVPAVSAGEIVRANVAAGSLAGRRARPYVDAGEYVPDWIINELVRDRLQQPDARGGWILDGYPRTLPQLEELDRFCAATGRGLDAVVDLEVNQDELVRRLSARADPARHDDTEDTMRFRLRKYRERTLPLLAVFAERDLLHVVNGQGEVAEVTTRILTALQSGGPGS